MNKRRGLFVFCRAFTCAFICFFLNRSDARAQTELKITADSKLLPIAVPVFCDREGAKKYAVDISGMLLKDLRLPGVFAVLERNSYIETPGVCLNGGEDWFSNWTPINATLVVRGDVKIIGTDSPQIDATLVLYNTENRQAVLTKHYLEPASGALAIAHLFAAEVTKLYSGESGVFGTKLAYIENHDGKTDIFIVDVHGADPKQVTRDGSVIGPLAWSPDGRRIVYTSKKSGRAELWLYNLAEGSEKQITDLPGVEPGAVFFEDAKNLLGATRVGAGVELVKLNTWGRVLDKLDFGIGDKSLPSLSPDEKQVAFVVKRADTSAIYAAGISGANLHQINSTGSAQTCTAPGWSPSNRYIAFSCEQSGTSHIFLRPIDGGDSMQITFTGDNRSPAWSPDGKALVYSAGDKKSSHHSLTIFSLQSVRSWSVTSSSFDQLYPSWSPRALN